MTTLKTRLEQALAEMPEPRPKPADLARAAKVKGASVSDWFSGKTKSLRGASLLAVARALDVNPEWLNTGRGPMRPASNVTNPVYRVAEPGATWDASSEIELLDARGSCGGGSIVWEMQDRAPLIKEPQWFRRYKVRPEDLVALFADGDSMAEFIVDGDIVIFDTSKTDPRSGQIFLIEHPDGLRIKRLRREMDGAWVLESLNVDKRRYPDERIAPDQAEMLRIRGQFVYRQGG